jgi:hypothetical protein
MLSALGSGPLSGDTKYCMIISFVMSVPTIDCLKLVEEAASGLHLVVLQAAFKALGLLS